MRHSFIAAMLVLLVGSTAMAATPKHETLINGSFGSTVDATIGGGPDGAVLNAGHLIGLGDLFQVGGVLGAGYLASTFFLNAKLLANLNFQLSPEHTLIVGGAAGWDNITDDAARVFVWQAFVGTRCKIVEHLYWRPTVGVKDAGGGIGLSAELLSLSLTY